ncbi:hypothetical protein Pint_15966 [Pistacia integerrima]|uniref:Uncharacterized protein n=1 Tax=Pistacia integerrima TaxID=434235 RepID=A0ACC0ZCR9_9ROSI|nr:hypothetical protein Pint_15966 [Pistacia integerrima]
MDNIPSSTFHFDQTDHDHHDLLVQLSSYPNCQQDQSNNSDFRQPRKASNASFGVNDDNPRDSKKRKIMHRDIERQRRQEMATLYRDLRSLLPLEYLKGKRSISDHMYEAVKYIKDLQSRIQETGERRDELQRFSESSALSFPSECSQVDKHKEDSVTVRACLEGIEVVVSATLTKGLPLSRVLEVLSGEGLNIVNCMSTKINESFLHTIQSEVSDGRSIDMCELQRKIMKSTFP